jgi:hypothetical protein
MHRQPQTEATPGGPLPQAFAILVLMGYRPLASVRDPDEGCTKNRSRPRRAALFSAQERSHHAPASSLSHLAVKRAASRKSPTLPPCAAFQTKSNGYDTQLPPHFFAHIRDKLLQAHLRRGLNRVPRTE